MNFARGVAVWLGAPLLASLVCTSVWAVAGGMAVISSDPAAANWRVMIGVGEMTLLFTIPGSAILSGIFGLMNSRSTVYRQGFIIGFGIVGGGAAMLLLKFPAAIVLIGCIYGFVTACFWIGLHRITHRPRPVC